MADDTIIGVDIDAIREAVAALRDADVRVTEVETVDRNDDGQVRWTMTCEAETRHADVDDWLGDGDA